MKKLLVSAFFFLIISIISRAGTFPGYRFHTMPETSYYGGIHSIAKDGVGRIWFSGFDAVYQYDGVQFRQMNGLISRMNPNAYWSFGNVVSDNNGFLYVASNNGLQRFNEKTLEFDCVKSGNIGSLWKTDDRTIWFISDGKVFSYQFDNDSFIEYKVPGEIASDIPLLTLSSSGEHIFLSSGEKVYTLQNKSFVKLLEISPETAVVRDIKEDSSYLYILTMYNGMYQFDKQGNLLKIYNLPIQFERAANAKQLYLTKDGFIWIAMQYGLMLVNTKTSDTQVLTSNLYNHFSLPGNSVWSIYEDPDGGIWLGTYGGKLVYVTERDSDVDYFVKPTPGGLNNSIVSGFAEDAKGNIWISTEGGGLTLWKRKDNKFEHFTQSSANGLSSNLVKKLWIDKSDRLWVSFFSKGIQRYNGSRFENIITEADNGGKPISVYDFVLDKKGGIWMTDPDADLMYSDLSTRKVIDVSLYDPNTGAPLKLKIETLFIDMNGHLWLVTREGAYVIDPSNRKVLNRYCLDNQPYAVNNLCSFCVTSAGDIWFGTRGGGVNRFSEGVYSHISDSNSLNMDGMTVFGITEDRKTGNIWFSTDNGLYIYTYSDKRFVKSNVNRPSNCGAFYVRACFTTAEGEFLFGGTDGFIQFTPYRIKYNPHKPKVFFTDFLVNDSSFFKSFSGDKGLRLRHDQSNIEIRFSSDSYLNAKNNRFTYRLLGQADKWSELPNGQTYVRFTGLTPGEYRFEIKGANNDGIWGDSIASTEFTIRPPIWQSNFAYMVYILIIIAIGYFVWLYFTNKKMYANRLEMEELKEKKMRELTQARINFFTKISHDLKTPLTLILDPLKQLKDNVKQDVASEKYVEMIERNAVRIQRMISQLLLFRQIESQKITPDLQGGDFVEFLRGIFSMFEYSAEKKGIYTKFLSDTEELMVSFDHDVIEKIFTNLLSNAVKYTPESGEIIMSIHGESSFEGHTALTVEVTNTGTSIPDETKGSVFEAFNNVKTAEPTFESSNGLGLYIVKELVDTIGGSISLQSSESSVSFILNLTLDKADVESVKSYVSYSYVKREVDSIISEMDIDNTVKTSSRKTYTVVVIDDDDDLRKYIGMNLRASYNVYEASDGESGLELICRVAPNLVITDLVMKNKDGFDVCSTLRKDMKNSHIPIIVLSGAGEDSKIRALESGATVFIEKPFDINFLVRQISSLIKSQNEYKEHFSKKYIAEPSKVEISSADEALLKKAMDFIEKNIDNNEYDVEEFVSDMAVGRTLLYQKIKDITGMSIKEFILDIRLKRAAQLIRESQFTIAEVSDMTGFANPKYFSVCFKRHFNMTPSEYKNQG